MTADLTSPATAALALLGDLADDEGAGPSIQAVLGWDEAGRHLRTLRSPVPAATCARLDELPPSSGVPSQLTLDLGQAATFVTSSSGRTWRTWALPSIPVEMRHLALDVIVQRLALQLAGGAS